MQQKKKNDKKLVVLLKSNGKNKLSENKANALFVK